MHLAPRDNIHCQIALVLLAVKTIGLPTLNLVTVIAPVVRLLFSSRVDSFFDANITSRGVLPSICDSLYKYNLFHYLELWFSESIFPTYTNWKTIVKTKILEKEVDN